MSLIRTLRSAIPPVALTLLLAACQGNNQPAATSSSGGANSAPAKSSGGTEKLVVGYVALNATQLPSWVAKEQGIFAKNGLDVDLQYIPSGSSPTAALLSGQMQVLVAAEQPIQATLNGGDLVYIAAPTSTIFFSLYTKPDII